MKYLADSKPARQAVGVLLCLLLAVSAATSQTGKRRSTAPEKHAAEKAAEPQAVENDSRFPTLTAETDGKKEAAAESTSGVRPQKDETVDPSQSVETPASKYPFPSNFSDRSGAGDKAEMGAPAFSEYRKVTRQTPPDEAAETDAAAPTAQKDGSRKLKLGGHAGFVVPIYGYGNGSYSRFYDDFTFGFPVGLTLKPKGPVAIDFEFIFLSAASPNDRRFVFVIHPGVIYGFKKKYAVGVRAAYEANNNDAYGFTPLVSRSFKLNDKLNHFIEFDFPVRWNKRTVRVGGQNFNDRFLSGAWAVHYGVSF